MILNFVHNIFCCELLKSILAMVTRFNDRALLFFRNRILKLIGTRIINFDFFLFVYLCFIYKKETASSVLLVILNLDEGSRSFEVF